jgi:hypothetical protein
MARKRLTKATVDGMLKKADPYTMNQVRRNPPANKYLTDNSDFNENVEFKMKELHEGDKEIRDPATHMIDPSKAETLRVKASKCIKLARLLTANRKVSNLDIQRIATNLMELSDAAVSETVNTINDKPVLIEDWTTGEGKVVGNKTAKEVVVEDHTSEEGQAAKEQAQPINPEAASTPVTAPAAAPAMPVVPGAPVDQNAPAPTTEDEGAIDDLFDGMEDEESPEQEFSFGGDEGTDNPELDSLAAALFASDDDESCETPEPKEEDAKTAKVASKKGVRKIASAPKHNEMSASDLGMALFGMAKAPQNSGLF